MLFAKYHRYVWNLSFLAKWLLAFNSLVTSALSFYFFALFSFTNWYIYFNEVLMMKNYLYCVNRIFSHSCFQPVCLTKQSLSQYACLTPIFFTCFSPGKFEVYWQMSGRFDRGIMMFLWVSWEWEGTFQGIFKGRLHWVQPWWHFRESRWVWACSNTWAEEKLHSE